VKVLFVLLRPGQDLDALWSAAPAELLAVRPQVHLRAYPPASNARHLLSLVRASRDRTATRWVRGMLTAIAAGTGLGLVTNGVLAGYCGMFGGLLDIALPLGAFVGAFLGGFTAAMTGTEVARDEVRALAEHVSPGSILVQATAIDRAPLDLLSTHCAHLQLAIARCTSC
jgi:hypothetical protein